ncbi:alpha/beta hydrolase [Endozoicomonas sp. Mp262]|uniref:alpha/beta fold hydrolase n=1 Tax=Endozoicomonas sp. Mp262 TaxID=2919499 RepID=UPI0021DB34BC
MTYLLQDCLYRKSGIRPVVLVGNSMSGLIALDFASNFPEAVDGLIMSGSPGLVELNAGVSLNSLRKGSMETAQSLGNRVFYDIEKVPPRGIEDIQKICSQPENMKAMIKWLNISRKYDIESAAAQLECPVQLIWGDHDLITPGKEWSEFAEKNSGITYNEVAFCGHSPMLERPFEFIELMSFYINSIQQPLIQTA